MQIESIQNDKIKKLTRLMSKNNERRKSGIFIVEGVQENERAIRFGYTPTEFFICNDIFHGTLPSAVIRQ